MQFLDYTWSWASFHMFICHLCIFFCDMSVPIFVSSLHQPDKSGYDGLSAIYTYHSQGHHKGLFSAEGGSSHQIALLRLRLYSAPLQAAWGSSLPEILTSVLFLLKNKSASHLHSPTQSNQSFFLLSSFSMFSFRSIWCIHDVRVQQKALRVQIWELCLVPALPLISRWALAKSLNIIILQFLIREMKS